MELGGRGVRGIVIRNEEKIWRGNCREHYPFAKVTFQFPESVKNLTDPTPCGMLCSLHKKILKLPASFVHSYKVKKLCKKGLQFAFVCGTITVSKDKDPPAPPLKVLFSPCKSRRRKDRKPMRIK